MRHDKQVTGYPLIEYPYLAMDSSGVVSEFATRPYIAYGQYTWTNAPNNSNTESISDNDEVDEEFVEMDGEGSWHTQYYDRNKREWVGYHSLYHAGD